MTNQEKYEKALNLVRFYVPDVKVIKKSDSRLHRFIGWILSKVGNKGYMKDYCTTIGTTIALSSVVSESTLWQIVLHEGVHARDNKKLGKLPFAFLYLFPQSLGILGLFYSLLAGLAVLGGASLFWLLGLFLLIFLAPMPAPLRAYTELKAYAITMAVSFWTGNRMENGKFVDSLVEIFSGPDYYYMLPFKPLVRWYFDKKLVELRTGTLELDGYLTACRNLALEPNT